MRRARTLGLTGVLPLYLTVATAAGFVDYRVRPLPDYGHAEYVPTVLDRTAPAPARYRVLGPHVYDALTRWTDLDPRDGWLVFRWLCLVGALLAGHLYLRTWFATGAAVAGCLLAIVLLPLTYTNGWAHPDHLLELALFTLACACVARGWSLAFVAVLALSALNRETSAFLLPLFFLAGPVTRQRVVWSLAAVAVWGAVYLGLRWHLGWVSYDPWQAVQNIRYLGSWPVERDLYYRLFPWFFVLLVAPALVLVARTWAIQPRFNRIAAGLVTPVVLVVGFLFSSVIEPRVFTPVIPLVVPGVLFALFCQHDQNVML